MPFYEFLFKNGTLASSPTKSLIETFFSFFRNAPAVTTVSRHNDQKRYIVTYSSSLSYVHRSLSFFSALMHIYVLLLYSSCCHGLFLSCHIYVGLFLSFFSSSFYVVIDIFLRCSSMGFSISGIFPFPFHIYIQWFSCGEQL